jgi:predicted nucleic acid-binding protein
MLYLDSSVVLAELLAETRRMADAAWYERLTSSRLLEYEVWNRLHARGFGSTHAEGARRLLARISLLDLTPSVLKRAHDPFPSPARTLDALHLASMTHLLGGSEIVQLASFDARMISAARALGIAIYQA